MVPKNTPVNDAVVSSATPGLSTFMFDDERLRNLADDYEQKVREDASSYETPCIFNIHDYETEINSIMNHMIIWKPRA